MCCLWGGGLFIKNSCETVGADFEACWSDLAALLEPVLVQSHC